MLEVLACIKGVAGTLQQAEVWLSAYLHQAMYAQMQHFVQLLLTQASLGQPEKVSLRGVWCLPAVTKNMLLASCHGGHAACQLSQRTCCL